MSVTSKSGIVRILVALELRVPRQIAKLNYIIVSNRNLQKCCSSL